MSNRYIEKARDFITASLIATFIVAALAGVANSIPLKDLPKDISLTISGTVKEISHGNFTLNYGSGNIDVDTEKFYGESFFRPTAADRLTVGERVTVSGYIDKNTFGKKKIDAHTVIRDNGNVMYTAIRAPDYTTTYYRHEDGGLIITGIVSKIPNSNEFLLDYGHGTMKVKTSKMHENPLESRVKNPLHEGEVVVISGKADNRVFEKLEIDADRVTRLEVVPL